MVEAVGGDDGGCSFSFSTDKAASWDDYELFERPWTEVVGAHGPWEASFLQPDRSQFGPFLRSPIPHAGYLLIILHKFKRMICNFSEDAKEHCETAEDAHQPRSLKIGTNERTAC